MEEQKKPDPWLAIEKARTAFEKYKMRKLSGWMQVGPALGCISAIVVGFVMWMSESHNFKEYWWFFALAFAPTILLSWSSDINNEWQTSQQAKYALSTERWTNNSVGSEHPNYKHPYHGYDDDFVYTYRVFNYILYQLIKIVCGLSTLLFAVVAAILLFLWLGNISIAPTTIIIILLIAILLKR